MEEALRQVVWEEARACCEYCRIPQWSTLLPFAVDHIIARKHQGLTSRDNLCLSCYNCNAYKGPNIAGIDSNTGEITRLFHPRQDTWADHFRWNGPMLVGKTAIARTTIGVLKVNLSERVEHRKLLIAEGVFPP